MTLYRRQESRPFSRKRNAKRQMVVEGGGLTIAEKGKGKRKTYPSECRVPKNSKEQ